MGRVVAIANQKGGVGKTTTAINLGASIGAAERNTLLIDLDPQSNATSGSGVASNVDPQKQIYQVLLGECSLDEVILPTESPHLFVAPATPDLIGFEVEGIELEGRELRLRRALEKVAERFDVILIDCPPSLGLLTLNAFCAANGVLIPLQCEYYALEGLGRLTKTLELIQQQMNPSLRLDGIVLTMFDRRNNLAHQVALEVESHFRDQLWKTRIPRNVRLSEAPSFGKPILLYDIRCVGSESYLALAEEFLQRMAGQSPVVQEGVSQDERTESIGEGNRVADSQLPATDH